MSDNEEMKHNTICNKARKNKDMNGWIMYGCTSCKKKWKKAQKSYDSMVTIAKNADMETEGSEMVNRERAQSMKLHDGSYHSLIEHIFENEIITRELDKVKDKQLKSKIIMIWGFNNKLLMEAWRR